MSLMSTATSAFQIAFCNSSVVDINWCELWDRFAAMFGVWHTVPLWDTVGHEDGVVDTMTFGASGTLRTGSP